MATVTGYTAAKMEQLSNENIVDAHISGDNLILEQRDGTIIDVGSVRGLQGPPGTADPSIRVVTRTTRPTTGLFSGLAIYETDTRRFYIWNGGAWEYRGGLFICTSTTRPANPFGGLNIFEVDTNLFYTWDVNSGTWTYDGGVLIRTSSSRPGSPIEGLGLYETDTDKLLFWNLHRWDPPWNLPWGFIGEGGPTGLDQGQGTTMFDLPGAAVAFTSPGNRRYKISAQMSGKVSSVPGYLYGVIRDGGNTELRTFYQQASSDPNDTESGSGFITHVPAAGVVTYKLSSVCSNNSGLVWRSPRIQPVITVEDIGPSGPPV